MLGISNASIYLTRIPYFVLCANITFWVCLSFGKVLKLIIFGNHPHNMMTHKLSIRLVLHFPLFGSRIIASEPNVSEVISRCNCFVGYPQPPEPVLPLADGIN